MWFESHCPGNGVFSIAIATIFLLLILGMMYEAAWTLAIYVLSFVVACLLSFVSCRLGE
jgi:hypothetical protein